MEVRELSIATGDRYVTDVTDHCDAFANEVGGDGLMHVFLPHATATATARPGTVPITSCRRSSAPA